MGCWFLPWTVTRAIWHKAIKSHVSGVSTDVSLFSKSGSSLVHHYRVFGRSAAHASRRGKFMAKLRNFTVQAVAEARWEFIVYRSGEISYRCRRTLFAAFDPGVQMINPRSERSAGRYPQSYRQCQLTPCHPSMIASPVKSSAGPAASYVSPARRPRSLLYSGRSPMVPVSL